MSNVAKIFIIMLSYLDVLWVSKKTKRVFS